MDNDETQAASNAAVKHGKVTDTSAAADLLAQPTTPGAAGAAAAAAAATAAAATVDAPASTVAGIVTVAKLPSAASDAAAEAKEELASSSSSSSFIITKDITGAALLPGLPQSAAEIVCAIEALPMSSANSLQYIQSEAERQRWCDEAPCLPLHEVRVVRRIAAAKYCERRVRPRARVDRLQHHFVPHARNEACKKKTSSRWRGERNPRASRKKQFSTLGTLACYHALWHVLNCTRHAADSGDDPDEANEKRRSRNHQEHGG